jgi:hypothetical protein
VVAVSSAASSNLFEKWRSCARFTNALGGSNSAFGSAAPDWTERLQCLQILAAALISPPQ